MVPKATAAEQEQYARKQRARLKSVVGRLEKIIVDTRRVRVSDAWKVNFYDYILSAVAYSHSNMLDMVSNKSMFIHEAEAEAHDVIAELEVKLAEVELEIQLYEQARQND